MANPSTPVSPFLKAGTAKKAASTVSPFLRDNKQAAADNSPLAAILNFGQSAINTISTPMYAVQGTINEIVNQSKAGNANPADALWKSIQAGNKNATSWTRGEKTIMGQDLLKNMGILDKKESGGDFWAGLAADVLLDPLTYVPFGVFATALKAPVIAGRSAVKAGKLASTGQLAESVARRAATSATAKNIIDAAPAGERIAFKPLKRKLTSGYTPARIDLARATAQTAEQYKVPLTKQQARGVPVPRPHQGGDGGGQRERGQDRHGHGVALWQTDEVQPPPQLPAVDHKASFLARCVRGGRGDITGRGRSWQQSLFASWGLCGIRGVVPVCSLRWLSLCLCDRGVVCFEALFVKQMKYAYSDIRHSFPLLTIKRVVWRGARGDGGRRT